MFLRMAFNAIDGMLAHAREPARPAGSDDFRKGMP